jgi:ABC-2 type transport system permease protein
MISHAASSPVLIARDLLKSFQRSTGEVVRALDGVSFEVSRGSLSALVGPDGAGKTTLMRLITGLLTADAGQLTVLDIDVAAHPQQVQNRLGYMPQRFGLYEDLSVQENLDLYADLHGVSLDERRRRYPQLMEMTALGPFARRLAGRLSGGMKQKLGLACTLVRSPELLLLDEPTVGVDPLSRRELWEIILRLVDVEGITVFVSTSYLDEAERCRQAIVLHQGRVLADGNPAEVEALAEGRTFLVAPPVGQTARGLQSRLLHESSVVDAVPEGGQVRLVVAEPPQDERARFALAGGDRVTPAPPRFEDGFMVLLHRNAPARPVAAPIELEHPPARDGGGPVVECHNLVRRFGAFTAVDHVSFKVRRGEVFGLLGPNGAGKTTTFRMLCGLLAASEGTLRVAGVDLRRARASARARIGYVAQKFSLYGQLAVGENLDFFAGAYGLYGAKRAQRMAWAVEQFELHDVTRMPAEQLPGGYKQRLAMAAALMHQPEIVFLDEPTSGVDPLARREFWQRITTLAEQGMTVIVTTHFMEEAEYCDRVAILDSGRILAQGTPAEIRRAARPGVAAATSMEEAFIAIVELARKSTEGAASRQVADEVVARGGGARLPPHARRVWSLVRKEVWQMMRDASSVAIGIVLPVILILLFGYGLSLDVRDAPLALVLEDQSPEATALAGAFQLSPYFDARLVTSMPQARQLMLAEEVDAIVCIRSNFTRNLTLGQAEIQVLIHGTDANRARILQRYIEGAVGTWSARRAAEGRPLAVGPVTISDRMWFNEANESRYFLVPGLIVLIMTLIGAFLTALVMAREWERGTLESLFVTPVRAQEILLSKTIPYFVLGMIGLALCIVTTQFLFHVPLRGSLWVLLGASMLYLLVALNIGLFVSASVKSQFVASELTIIVTFLPAMMLSGFLFDLRSVPTFVRLVTYVLPARYFVAILQSVFLAGNVWTVFLPSIAVLAVMAVFLRALARLSTRKQLV